MKELSGKVFLVTGASSGIGRVTAEVLAARGADLLLACRSIEKALPVLQGISARGGTALLLELDLSDLDSVRACAEQVLSLDRPLDVLINNAGLAGSRGTTRQGFELAFGVNHLGHFLLTQLLLPRLLSAQSPRVVNVSSKAHYNARGVDFEALRGRTRTTTGLREYGVSKLCNVLHAKELVRRYGARGLFACSLHPGVVASDVWRQVPQPLRWLIKRSMISNEQGAETTLYCATSDEALAGNGLYYDERRPKDPNPLAHDAALARVLWERSAAWTAEPGN